MMSFYLTYKEYLKKRYNEPLYSVTVDLDLGCPSQCSFCPTHGSRSAQSMDAKSVEEQIKVGIAFAKKRYNAKRFMLYLQAYTSTFTSLKQQKKTYEKLLKLHDFDAISIGTRPDCLSKGTLLYLQELNKEIDVYIDLGIQTLNDKTLQNINRGHDSKSSIEAIKKLKEYGLSVYAHLIIGFKGESREDWSKTVKELVALKVDGFKIHNLHIVKNTPLHVEHMKEPFDLLDEFEYADELIYLLGLIPKDIPILRIATDTPKKELISPRWGMSKDEFKEYIHDTLEYRFGKSDVDDSFWSERYKDYYYPKSGAIKQARELFIKKSKLKERLESKDVNLLDIGYGFGVNSNEALRLKSRYALHVTALDQDFRIVKPREDINFIGGDIRYTLPRLKEKFDVIFLDPFREDKNQEMVCKDVINHLKRVLKSDGMIVTSTSLASTKKRFEEAGFKAEIINIKDIRGLVLHS